MTVHTELYRNCLALAALLYPVVTLPAPDLQQDIDAVFADISNDEPGWKDGSAKHGPGSEPTAMTPFLCGLVPRP